MKKFNINQKSYVDLTNTMTPEERNLEVERFFEECEKKRRDKKCSLCCSDGLCILDSEPCDLHCDLHCVID